jgi:ABC-2 type transport system permease protein
MDGLNLLRPRWLGALPKAGEGRSLVRLASLAVLGSGFVLGCHLITIRVLRHFQQAQDIGNLLAYKLLSLLMVTSFSLLLFSAILTGLTKLFLSRDLELIHSLPVASESVFEARWLESVLDASWMVVVFAIPVLAAYGRIFHAGMLFYLLSIIDLAGLCVVASAIAVLAVMLGVFLVPASRLHGLVMFLGIAAFVGLYVAFRLSRPERLADPETFSSVLVYVEHLRGQQAWYLPTTWCTESLKAGLNRRSLAGILDAALLWSFAVFLSGVSRIVARHFYFRAYSRSRSAPVPLFPNSPIGADIWQRIFPVPGTVRGLFVKEWRCFFRDQAQWSQLILICALVVVYIYNYEALPLDKLPVRTEYLQNLLAFLNMALAAFVLTALSGRFAYPAVSAEGRAFWLIRSAPISIRRWLWIKFGMVLLPFWLLGLLLVIACNLKLDAGAWMMGLSMFTMTMLTPAILGLGLGLGAAFADFHIENPTQSITSFGGMVFMILSASLIGVVLMIEAGPVHRYLLSQIYHHRPMTIGHWSMLALSISVVAGVCVTVLLTAMRYGEKKLLQ